MILSALTYDPYLILYTNQIFDQEFYLFHISSHAIIPLLTYSLQCCLELTVLWVSMTAFNSIVRLAHGKPVLSGWARLVVLVGFGWPGSLLDVLRLHVPHIRVGREHAHFSLTVHAVEEHRGVQSGVSRSRSGNGSSPASILCVLVWLLFICTVYICTDRRSPYWLMFIVCHTTLNEVYLILTNIILSYLSYIPIPRSNMSFWITGEPKKKKIPPTCRRSDGKYGTSII